MARSLAGPILDRNSDFCRHGPASFRRGIRGPADCLGLDFLASWGSKWYTTEHRRFFSRLPAWAPLPIYAFATQEGVCSRTLRREPSTLSVSLLLPGALSVSRRWLDWMCGCAPDVGTVMRKASPNRLLRPVAEWSPFQTLFKCF